MRKRNPSRKIMQISKRRAENMKDSAALQQSKAHHKETVLKMNTAGGTDEERKRLLKSDTAPGKFRRKLQQMWRSVVNLHRSTLITQWKMVVKGQLFFYLAAAGAAAVFASIICDKIFSNLTVSAANFLIPSLNFSVAI